MESGCGKDHGLYEQYHSTGNELYLEQAKEIIYNEDTPLQTEMGNAATELDTFLEKSMAEERTRIENSVKGTFFAIIAAMVAATIGVLVLAFALIRNVTGPTEEVRNAWWALARQHGYPGHIQKQERIGRYV